MAQTNPQDLPPGYIRIGGRNLPDTVVMNYGFELPPDPLADQLRSTARGERVTSDCNLLVALVTGKIRILSRHWVLRNRTREVRTPWWWQCWLPKYKRTFHGRTPWWVLRKRRESFCAMVQVNGMADLTALVVRLLEEKRFTLRQLELFLARTPLLAEVAARFHAAQKQFMRTLERVPAKEAADNALLAILEGDSVTWLGRANAHTINLAVATGQVRNLYDDHKISDETIAELIHHQFCTDVLEPVRPVERVNRRRLVRQPDSTVDTGELKRFVGDGSNLLAEAEGR